MENKNIDELEKTINNVFEFLKTKRDKRNMKVNFDDLEIRKYKEQLKKQLKAGGKNE